MGFLFFWVELGFGLAVLARGGGVGVGGWLRLGREGPTILKRQHYPID